MAEITGQSLIQDWYDRYVLPKKSMKDAFSGAKPDLSLGTPPSTSPMGYRGPGIAGPPSLTKPETTPAAAPVMPAAPSPEDQLRDEFGLDDAVGIQDYTPDPSFNAAPEKAATKASGWEGLSEGMKDPLKVGILGMGLSMMATPPRAVPYSGAEIIGKAGLSGLGIYEKALEAKRRQQALDQTAEEHKLSREALIEDRRGRLEVARDNAASNKVNREAMASYRVTLETNRKLLAAPVPDEILIASGHPELIGKGVTGNQWKEYGMGQTLKPRQKIMKPVIGPDGKTPIYMDINAEENQSMLNAGELAVPGKPGYHYTQPNDKGEVKVVKDGEVVGTIPDAGKTKTPPKPPGGGSAASSQYNDWKAAFTRDNKREPTADEIRAYKAGGPTGKAAAGGVRDALKTPQGYLRAAKDRESAKRRIKKMAEAGYTRQQIQDALKGTQWE